MPDDDNPLSASRVAADAQLRHTEVQSQLNAVLHGFARQLMRLQEVLDQGELQQALTLQARFVNQVSNQMSRLATSLQAITDQMREELDEILTGGN